MKILIDSHPFHYEMENLTRLFFPNEKLEVIKTAENCGAAPCEEPYVITRREETGNTAKLTASVSFGSYKKSSSAQVPCDAPDYDKSCERCLAILLFRLLSEYTGITPPWGILTGVRPVKLFRSLARRYGREAARVYFEDILLVSKEKTNLAYVTESNEQKILERSGKDSFSLYISIPFCPTRCSYCSFVSQTIERAQELIEPYTELLCRELAYTGALAKKLGLRLETVYMAAVRQLRLAQISWKGCSARSGTPSTYPLAGNLPSRPGGRTPSICKSWKQSKAVAAGASVSTRRH